MFIYDNDFDKKELILGLKDVTDQDSIPEKLTEINQMINSLGITFAYDTTAVGDCVIKICFDTPQIDKCRKRNAGRPRNYKVSSYSYGDIHAWRKEGKTTKEIIEILDCSRATYYRRLKEAKRWNTTDEAKWLG